MAERPFITCHVLDTVTGKPAVNVRVTLKLIQPDQIASGYWTARTNPDGRVGGWEKQGLDKDVNEVATLAKSSVQPGETIVWSLTFETEEYFGVGNTFWPQVELRISTKKEEEHYHVPLLLGPWSYTTYRGS